MPAHTASPRIPLRHYWRLLRQYLLPQRTAAALMAALLLASIGLQLAGPRVTRAFIDQARGSAADAVLLQTALLFLAVALLAQAMKMAALYWSDRVGWTAANALRVDLAAHLLQLGASFHKQRTPGELIERVDGDVSALAGFFSDFVVRLVGSLLLLLGVLGSLLAVNVWLGLAFAAFAASALLLLGWMRRFATPLVQETRERSAALYGYLGEAIAATEDLRSSGAMPYALRRFGEHIRGWLPLIVQADVASNLLWATATVAFGLGTAVAYAVGGGLFRAGAIPLGTVYLVVAYMALLADPIQTIRQQFQQLQRADAAIHRIRDLLALRPQVADGAALLPTGALAVELDHVSFRYDDSAAAADPAEVDKTAADPADWVLHDLSFRLAPGRTLGLLGRTGSGKSTIARLLFRLYDPAGGAIRLAGTDLRQANIATLRQRVGLVTQDVQLFTATLRDNITFFHPALPDSRLLAVLADLGLGPWLARQPQGLDTQIAADSLSAGEAQLLAFARVFLQDPGLIILDEASSRLDPATEALLDRAVRRLLAGRTAIIIAHRLATVEQVDDILVLADGRLLEHGPRTELAANPHSRFAQLRQVGLAEVLR